MVNGDGRLVQVLADLIQLLEVIENWERNPITRHEFDIKDLAEELRENIMAVIIGSLALKYHLDRLMTEKSHRSQEYWINKITKHPFYRYGSLLGDIDVICPLWEAERIAKRFKCFAFYPLSGSKWVGKYKDALSKGGIGHIEFEIVWPGDDSSTNNLYAYSLENGDQVDWFGFDHTIAPILVLYLLKMSHRFLRNSPHFEKTRKDIQFINDVFYGWENDSLMNPISCNQSMHNIFLKREKETYNYSHPKLNTKKDQFFVDEYKNMVDHDWLHELIAIGDRPAYLSFKDPTSDVWCSKKLWDHQPFEVKMNAVIEESTVLAFERSLIPFDFKPLPSWAYKFALQKVCTSITSGWFREFAWNNYFKALESTHILNHVAKIERLCKPKDAFAL